MLIIFFSVPVCGLSWHSMEGSFLVAYIDGVVMVAKKDSENIKTVQAHEVSSLVGFSSNIELNMPEGF